MNLKKCSHYPHVSRITFDIGFEQSVIYELCKNCKKLSVFSHNVIDVLEIMD